MELIEASKVHETIIDYRDKATDVESEIELERAYGANDVGELISQLPVIEAIPKDQYEARLKADIVSVLEEISLEIEELEKEADSAEFAAGWICGIYDSLTVIKNRIDILKTVQKINALRGEQP